MRTLILIMVITFYAAIADASKLHTRQEISAIRIEVILVKDLKEDLKRQYLGNRKKWEKTPSKENTMKMNLSWIVYDRIRNKKSGSRIMVYNNGKNRKTLTITVETKRGRRESSIIDVKDSARVITSIDPYKIVIRDHIRKDEAVYIVR